MFRRKKEIPQLERLNIVPIMDAVFIFIFFLLFSAQFVKIFEIETEAPIVSEVPQNKKIEDEPLNLIVKVFENKIELLTGIDHNLRETYFKDDPKYKVKLKNELIKLRLSYPKDDQAIIAPLATIKYDEIIRVIDVVQSIPKGEALQIYIKDKEKHLKKIFSQIVLEAMDEI